MQGPDGQAYIVALLHLQNADGEIATVNTPNGPVTLTLACAPVGIGHVPGLIVPQSAVPLIGGGSRDAVRR